MKIFKVVMAVLIFLLAIWLPESLFAQSNFLPEKANEVVQNETVNTTTSETTPAEKNTTPDQNSWIGVVAAVLFGALFLIFMEIAVIPGFGVCGIMGGICLLIGIGLAYWKLTTNTAIIVTVLAVFGVLAIVAFMIWVFPNTSLGKKFVLEDKAPDPEDLLAVSETGRFLGAEGIATSNLRPSGIAKIADERVDVITEGEFVEKGTKIKVIKATAGKVIVAPLDE